MSSSQVQLSAVHIQMYTADGHLHPFILHCCGFEHSIYGKEFVFWASLASFQELYIAVCHKLLIYLLIYNV